jgi:cytochrome c-type biogenesis protein
MTLAATRESLSDGVGLLFVYSAGLAIPFLLAAFLLQHFLGGLKRFGRWMPWISRISGVLLLVLGVLMLTGTFTLLNSLLVNWTPEFLLKRL